MDEEIECQVCGWTGIPSECVCSKEEMDSEKPAAECSFNLCPKCGNSDFEDID